MSTINIDKREVPVTARNGRVYKGTGTSTNVSIGGGSSVGVDYSTLTATIIPKYDGTKLINSALVDTGSALTYLGSPLLRGTKVDSFNGSTGAVTLTLADVTGVLTGTQNGHNHTGIYSLSTHNHSGVYEPILDNPIANGYILSSSLAGVRTWIAAPSTTDTLATVTARGAATTANIQTGNISIKDLLTIAATPASLNYINSLQPLYLKSNGVDKLLINDTSVSIYSDVTIKKTNATLILSSPTQTTEKVIFSDNGFTELEIGHDGINLDETYINANKPFSFKYAGVEKMSIGAAGVSSSTIEKALGNPIANGYVLSSSAAGVRSWVANGSGGSGSVTSVTAGNGMTQTGVATINPTIDIVSLAGTAGTVGTVFVGVDGIGVNLGTTSITAAAGNHTHSTLYAPISASNNYIQNQTAVAQTASANISGSIQVTSNSAIGTTVNPFHKLAIKGSTTTNNNYALYIMHYAFIKVLPEPSLL